MSYKIRNILVLTGFLVLISLVSGYLLLLHFPRKANKIEKDIKSLKKQVTALDGIEAEYYKLEEVIQGQEKKLAKLDKKIVSSVSPANTYKYLNTILDHSGFLEFNLLFLGEKEAKGYKYNAYSVKGEGNYGTIYRFIAYLEKGPEFYKIKKLNMRMVESKDEETGRNKIVVPFDMELWALFADVDELPRIKRTLNNVWVGYVTNPFYPHIYRNIPANADGLPEVERAELKAVLPNKAMIADNSGKVHVLKEGDPVYLGYVSKIDVEKNEVEFVLNKGGIVERFKLQLRFNESK